MANIDITNIDLGSVIVDVKQTDFEDGLLTFAGTDTFAAGTILARSTGKFVLYTGSNTAVAVLPYEVSLVGAGDVAVRAIVGGTVNKDRLVIDNGAPVTAAVTDALRDYGITPVSVAQLSNIDNPQT